MVAVASVASDRVASPRLTMVASLSACAPVSAASSARRKSAALWKRSSGRLAMARFTTASRRAGTCTFSTEGQGGSSFSTLCMMVVSAPVNGFSPVSSWYSTTPAENRSLRPSTVWPMNCSGDM